MIGERARGGRDARLVMRPTGGSPIEWGGELALRRKPQVEFVFQAVVKGGEGRNILVTMSILSSMEFVWFSLVLEGELGPPFGFLSPMIAETSGEKNPPMGSIPKASRWPVSLIVRPVFLDFRNLFVSYCPNFYRF